jgi:hypothetical protein
LLRQVMARRMSSASTDSEYVPAMVPFAWEVVPGRAAVPEITEAPSLPLPPGRRPKEGFYLPISRPAQLPELHDEARERRPFNLKFPGSPKTPSFPRQTFRDMGRFEDTHHGHGFMGSGITRRALVEFQRRGSSCLGAACTLLHGRKAHDHTGRRLDNFSEEDSRDPHPTPTHSAASESPPSSSSSHGNSSQPGAGAQRPVQSQVLGSSRFMASMLMVLCPDEVDAENGTSDDDDSFTFPEQSTMPRARVSSPDTIFQTPQQEIQLADPAPATMAAHAERTRAWVDHMPRCVSESVPATAHLQCELCGRRKPLQRPSTSLGTNLSDQSFSFPVPMADAHPLSSSEAFPDREEGRCLPSRPSFSWRTRHGIQAKQEPGPRSSSCADSSLSFLPNSSANSLQSNQAQGTALKDFRAGESWKVRPTVWFQEALQSSPRWPHPASAYAATNGDSDDESGSDSGISSVESSEHFRAVLQAPPVQMCALTPPPRAATWEVSEKLLKSSSLLQYKQRRQQSHESPRSSFVVDHEESAAVVTASSQCGPKGADLVPSGSCRVSETSDGVMGKVAQWESKAGVGSSGKSLPIYLSRRSGMAITGKACSR